MTERTTNPADLDAMIRRANRRGRLDLLTEAADAVTSPESEPPRPKPLPGGGAAPSTGTGEIDGNKWIRARIDSLRHGVPMPPAYRLTKDA